MSAVSLKLDRMNRDTRARLRAERLRAASRRVREDSMRVNAEFDAIEPDPMPDRGDALLEVLDLAED